MSGLTVTAPDLQHILLDITELAEFSVVARRLAEAAMQLTNADFAAIGAYDSGWRLARFEAVGVTDDEWRAIAHPPQGTGILGEFARTHKTINVDVVADHPRARGMPSGHPDVQAFLGVPVMYASQPIGAFYVGRRPGGRPFSPDEQERLEELAPYAAIAMANVRTLEAEHQRAVAAEALADAARGLQQMIPEHQTAEALADALEATFGDAAQLAVCWNTTAEEEHQMPPRWADSPLSRSVGRFLDDGAEQGAEQGATDIGQLSDGTEATVQTVDLDGGGTLALAVSYVEPFSITAAGRTSLLTLAEIGAVGLTAARRRKAQTSLERYAVRDEIARDLHDDLIQSIYAIGLSLRAARSSDPRANSAVSKASDDLNAVIRDLRSYIAHLSQRAEELTPSAMLATRINALLHDSGMQVSWSVDVDLSDGALGRQLERQLYLVVREAVSNVERHSNADSASLSLRRRGDALHLEVSDDGRGFDRSAVPDDSVGLRSIEERVADLGGSLVIASSPGQGTSLIATLPIPETNNGR